MKKSRKGDKQAQAMNKAINEAMNEALNKADEPYVTDAKLAVLHDQPVVTRWIVYVFFFFVVTVVVWSAFTKIDEIVRSEGNAIPLGQVQVVQNLEGGIVKSIMVREDQQVEKGDPLIEIDDTQANAELIQSESEYFDALVKSRRLLAESTGQKPEYS